MQIDDATVCEVAPPRGFVLNLASQSPSTVPYCEHLAGAQADALWDRYGVIYRVCFGFGLRYIRLYARSAVRFPPGEEGKGLLCAFTL